MADNVPPPPPSSQPPPPSGPPAGTTDRKPWWKRWWGIAAIVIGAMVVIGALTGAPEDEDTSPAADPTTDQTVDEPDTTSSPTEPVDDPTTPAAQDTTPEETQTTAPPQPSGIGDGTWVVGEDVEPGTYRSTGSAVCYWARLSGLSGEFDDIITNGNLAPDIVAVASSDVGFETQGCGEWLPLADTYPASPATSFTEGTFEVGTHIEPGRYRADAAGDTTCYWARLSGFSGEFDHIITNGNSPTVVEISPSDAGFTATGCGTWTRTG